MSRATPLEVAEKLLQSPLIIGVEFVGTKLRARLSGALYLDIYYNASMGKYSYFIVKFGTRIIGWDNAPHHAEVSTYPHHFYDENDRIRPSGMKGSPLEDLPEVLTYLAKYLQKTGETTS